MARQRFQGLLQIPVDEGMQQRRIRPGRVQSLGQMRGQKRQGTPVSGNGLLAGFFHLSQAQHANLAHARQDLVASRSRPLGITVRPQSGWGLRQHHQQRRLRRRQPDRFLAEPGQRGGAYPFQITAVGCQGQVKTQDVVLGIAAFQLQGAQHFAQLAGQIAPMRLQQASGLHGQGRGPRHYPTMPQPLPQRPRHRQRIDAGMGGKTLIFVGR